MNPLTREQLRASRDPRRDPIPGDVLVSRAHRRRTVKAVVPWRNRRSATVDFYTGTGVLDDCPLSSWRSWAKDATVLHRGDEPGPPESSEGGGS